MDRIRLLVHRLIAHTAEEGWLEFKDSGDDAADIGKSVSALSNTAAVCRKENAFMIWGVDKRTRVLTDTSFDFHKEVNGVHLEDFLIRQITPDISFRFEELRIKGKRVVVLVIPAAKSVPTAFDDIRYIRVGAGKANMDKFPERKSKLLELLQSSQPDAESRESARNVERPESAEGTEIVETVEAAETVEAVESVETVEPVETVESAEGTEIVEPVEAVESAERPESVETVEALEAAESAESVETTGNMENTESSTQELTFRKLFLYCEDKGVEFSRNTFQEKLHLLTEDGKYNLLAQLLSDNSGMPVQVSVYRGRDKESPLFSSRDFGNSCILISLDKVLEYGDVINIIQADEEVPLFDGHAFREAVVNAFVHSLWTGKNAPSLTVYSDRMEVSFGGGSVSKQPVESNRQLADIFAQLRISEQAGSGVQAIVQAYGKNAFESKEDSVVVTIPFEKVTFGSAEKAGDRVGVKAGNKFPEKEKALNPSRRRILKEMQKNPKITQPQLIEIVGIGKTAVQNNVSFLRKNGYIERVGANKNGYWEVLYESIL